MEKLNTETGEHSSGSHCSLFIVLAFRYGGHSNTFPIGVFRFRETAEKAAKDHHIYRGGKYDHRIYEFPPDRLDDDIGHAGNNAPCIEANAQALATGGAGESPTEASKPLDTN